MRDTLSAVVSIATATVRCMVASTQEKAKPLTGQCYFRHTYGSYPPLGKVIQLTALAT